jgi:hypothetical protein
MALHKSLDYFKSDDGEYSQYYAPTEIVVGRLSQGTKGDHWNICPKVKGPESQVAKILKNQISLKLFAKYTSKHTLPSIRMPKICRKLR